MADRRDMDDLKRAVETTRGDILRTACALQAASVASIPQELRVPLRRVSTALQWVNNLYALVASKAETCGSVAEFRRAIRRCFVHPETGIDMLRALHAACAAYSLVAVDTMQTVDDVTRAMNQTITHQLAAAAEDLLNLTQ
jgi:hypothetical protein